MVILPVIFRFGHSYGIMVEKERSSAVIDLSATHWQQAALAYSCAAPADAVFAFLPVSGQPERYSSARSDPSSAKDDLTDAAALELLLSASDSRRPSGCASAEGARRRVSLYYALCAVLPAPCRLAWPSAAGPLLCALYPDRSAKEPLLAILDQLESLRHSCAALPNGDCCRVAARQHLLHLRRTGGGEILDAVFNTSASPLIEPIGGKCVEVNAVGYTLTVREEGHSADHSYYDLR